MNVLTKETQKVHSPCEHSIVKLLTGAAEQQAMQLQQQLVAVFGDAIWLQEPPSIHSTLMEVISNTKYETLTRQQHFNEWYSAYNDTVKQIISTIEPFTIHFTELHISQYAIIIKAPNTTKFNMVRKLLLAKTKQPEQTKIAPDITHSTMARFAKSIDLTEARKAVKKIEVDITVDVQNFSLVPNYGPPHFNGTPLVNYPLKK